MIHLRFWGGGGRLHDPAQIRLSPSRQRLSLIWRFRKACKRTCEDFSRVSQMRNQTMSMSAWCFRTRPGPARANNCFSKRLARYQCVTEWQMLATTIANCRRSRVQPIEYNVARLANCSQLAVRHGSVVELAWARPPTNPSRLSFIGNMTSQGVKTGSIQTLLTVFGLCDMIWILGIAN